MLFSLFWILLILYCSCCNKNLILLCMLGLNSKSRMCLKSFISADGSTALVLARLPRKVFRL